jgi:hypothetical protein
MREGRNWYGVLRTLRSFLINCSLLSIDNAYSLILGSLPVIGAVLIIIHELEAIDIVHELNSNIVSDEDDVIAGSRVCAQVCLGCLGDARVPNERRPNEAVNSLVPQHSAEGGIVQAGEETNNGLIVVLPNFLSNETRLVLVVNS